MNITSFRKLFMGTGDMPDNAPVSMRDITVSLLAEFLEDYAKWYSAHGIHLPPSFETDPTAWTEALRKMARAFNLLNDEQNKEGELWKAKYEWEEYGEKDVAKIEELEKEIKEGLLLFGQNLYFMTDPKKGTVKGR